MKKVILFFSFLFLFISSRANESKLSDEDSMYIGVYHEESFNLIFTNDNIQILVDSLNAKLSLWLLESGGFSGTLQGYELDDQAPFMDTAVAYLSLKLYDAEKELALSVHLVLEKQLINGDVYYKIDTNNETVAAKGAVCKSLSGCNGCDKVRKWLFGPVKRCDCNTEGQDPTKCELTSGDTDGWGILQTLAAVAAAVVTIIKALE